jgi:hypothetical protein
LLCCPAAAGWKRDLRPELEAFLWDAANGLRSLKTVLTTQFGLDLTGWRLTEATGISDDGKVIVGTGPDKRWMFSPSDREQMERARQQLEGEGSAKETD